MFKNKNDLSNNICGKNVRRLRSKTSPCLSQRKLAELLGQEGIVLNKNAIQRIESGQRFVTDIELTAMARVFGVTVEELTWQEKNEKIKYRTYFLKTLDKEFPIPYNSS